MDVSPHARLRGGGAPSWRKDFEQRERRVAPAPARPGSLVDVVAAAFICYRLVCDVSCMSAAEPQQQPRSHAATGQFVVSLITRPLVSLHLEN